MESGISQVESQFCHELDNFSKGASVSVFCFVLFLIFLTQVCREYTDHQRSTEQHWYNPVSFNLPAIEQLPCNQLGTKCKICYEDSILKNYAIQLETKDMWTSRITISLETFYSNVTATICLMVKSKKLLKEGNQKKILIGQYFDIRSGLFDYHSIDWKFYTYSSLYKS